MTESGPNVSLKKWTPDDWKLLLRLGNSVDRTYLADHIPEPYTERDARWWLNMVNADEGKGGAFRMIIVDEEPVGVIFVEQKADVYRKDAEIGYCLMTREWSKGIMTEAVRQMCAEAFSELDLVRITGLVYETNTASRKVLENNGFILEGIMRNAVYKNNHIYNLCVYGKLR